MQSVIIYECQKREACWTQTDSPGFVRGQQSRGYSETQRRGLYVLSAVKKNSMWMLWNNTSGLLRPQGAEDTGPVLRRDADLYGSGNTEGQVPEVREGEAGEVSLACRQPFLHESFCLVCGEEVPGLLNKGRGKGTQAGLEDGEGTGEGVYAGATSKGGNTGTKGNRDR